MPARKKIFPKGKPKRKPPPKISQKKMREFIAQFSTVPKSKAAVTRKYRELPRKTANLKFIKVKDAATRKRYKEAGAIVTDKGVFIRKREGMAARLDHGILKEKGGVRTEYFIPLSEIESAAFVGDPESVVNAKLSGEYAWILAEHPGEKYYIRFTFARNVGGQDFKAQDLAHYMASGFPTVVNTRTGKVKKTTAQRREQFTKSLTGFRVVFAGQKTQDGSTKWQN